MKIYTWSGFSKRRNSTKQPNIASATEVVVVLKEDTNIENPSFILTSASKPTIDYIKAFDEYYFVSNITCLTHSQWQIDCEMDPMATFKSDILASSQFVSRSTSNYNTMLPDPMVSIKNSETITENVTSVATLFNENGLYIISVLNNKGSGAGFCTYYLMTQGELVKLAQYCNANLADSGSITDIVQWLQATFLKTADAIIDCKWMPLSATAITGLSGLSVETLYVGKDEVTGVTGWRFTDTVIKSATYTLTPSYTYNDFRLGEPYTKAFLFIPFYGVYRFNALDFPTTISLQFDLDLATGDMTVYLSNGTKLITTLNYNIAVNSPVGKVGNDAGGVISSTLGTAGGVVAAIASKGATAVASGISASASAINGISSALSISPSIKGSLAGRSMAADGLDIHLILICNDTTDPANLTQIVGRPLMVYQSLSALTGYCQCQDASIDIAGFAGERDAINSFLNGGFYIE